MNKRHQQILSLLSKDDWITGKELSNILKVTDRTIRYDIEKINNEFNEVIIDSNIRQGYRLKKDINKIESPTVSIPQTPRERCLYIVKKLLLSKNKISINELIDEIYISEYSLDNDLKKIKESLKKYNGLSITKSNQTLALTGSEQNKRKLYKDMLMKETNNNLFNLNDVASLYTKFDLLKIKQILENILDKYNYQISSVSFPILILHIGVTIERLLNFNYLDKISINVKVENTLEYKIAEDFFDELSKLYQINKQESEITLLAILIMSKKNQNLLTLSNSLKYETVVQELINYIYSQYSIDFSIDNELAVGLSLHIQSLVERSKINAVQSNLYLDEIKKKYPLIFDIAISACDFLQKKLKIKISEPEIGFFALHLGTAYERQNLNKYKAVLIIPQEASYNSNVLKRIKYTFEHHLDIIEVLSYYEKETIKNLNPDLIISSIPLKHDLNIVSAEISIFFNYQDEVRVFQSINECEKRKLYKAYNSYFNDIIRKENFFSNKQFSSPSEAITFLCDNLVKKGEVEKDYLNSVLDREKMSNTSFIQGIAIPHSLSNSAINKSSISIMILDKPLTWGNYEVQIIFLLTIKNFDSNVMKLFFDWINDFSNDITKFSSVLKSKSFEEFVDLFE